VVTLKLHADSWDDEGPVQSFLKGVPPRQVGPDGAVLTFTFQFVKPGKGRAFAQTAWELELETKVRSMVVARWVLDRISEVSDVRRGEGSRRGLDDIGLALRIEAATRRLDRGTRSDRASGEDDDA
jgi:hypothetical protein